MFCAVVHRQVRESDAGFLSHKEMDILGIMPELEGCLSIETDCDSFLVFCLLVSIEDHMHQPGAGHGVPS